MKNIFRSVLMFGLMTQGIDLVAGPGASRLVENSEMFLENVVVKSKNLSGGEIVAIIATTAVIGCSLACAVNKHESQDESYDDMPELEPVPKSKLELENEAAVQDVIDWSRKEFTVPEKSIRQMPAVRYSDKK